MESNNEDIQSVKKLSHVRRFGLLYGFILGKVVTLLVIFLLVWFALLDAPMPWKVTDPADPQFDPLKFEYTDYNSKSELKKSLEILLPIGTDKSYVDKILVEIGKGKVKKLNYKHETLKDKITYRYGYNNIFRKIPMYVVPMLIPLPPADWSSHYISVDYDKNNKVKRVAVLQVFGLPVFFVKKSKERKAIERIINKKN